MLTLHFLNVGHGDCTFVELPSARLMMIDINNSTSLPESDVLALAEHEGVSLARFMAKGAYFQARSWEDYYESLLVDPHDYYVDHFSGRSVFRYIQTHPDMDHMGGLHRFFWQEEVTLENFWDVEHNKTKDEDDFANSPYAYVDWLVYRLLRDGTGPNNSTHKVIHNLRGDNGHYWSDDSIEVLSPTTELISACNTSENYNNCSYVLKLTYAGRTVILPGDAERPAWTSMLEDLGEDAMKCDVFKAAHHGRESGYDEDAVSAMSPDIVICSVGKKPSTDASDEYASHGADVLSTRFHGTITVSVDSNGKVTVKNRKGEEIAALPRLY